MPCITVSMMRRWEESFIVEMRDDDNERRCCSLFVALCQICVPLSKPVVQEDWISRAFGGFDGSPREEKQILPPFQKDGYTLLRETYLKTPGADRDSNHTIRN